MNILGLNAYHGDSAACLVIDGNLVAGVEEERFCRIKHWAGLPIEAVKYCLRAGNIQPIDLDHIAINRDPRANMLKKALYAFSKRPSLHAIRDRLNNASQVRDIRLLLAEKLGVGETKFNPLVHHIEHHRAHFASTFFVSPFESAAIASVDGFGDFVSTMTGVGEGAKLQIFDHVSFPHSLGLFYLAMTQYLGFPSYGDEYKVMGLAACGKPEFLGALRKIVKANSKGGFVLDLDYFLHHSEGVSMSWEHGAPTIGKVFSDKWVQLLGPKREMGGEITQRHKNLASSLQHMYEEVFFHVLDGLYQQTQMNTLCLAGGCALNSVANGKIASETPFQHVYVPPAAGDAGGAIGAAFSVWHEELGQPRFFVMERPDWGPEFEDVAIQAELKKREHELLKAGCSVEYQKDEEQLCRSTAERVAKGEVVGWFQGRMELGARALGHRSIIADPRRADMKDILNARIKRREDFRPFAPSILEEATGEYFERSEPSPFMTMTYRVRPEKQSVIPAPTHVDGTGRLQTVSRNSDPLYWRLIKAFDNLTGVPVLLNTSFNENEPIVCTPEQAIDCFLRTKMDVLVLGSFVIESNRENEKNSPSCNS